MAIKLQNMLKIQGGLFVLVLVAALSLTSSKAEAACAPQDTSRGTVTSTFTAPASGTYRVWARMAASSATNDSFVMEIDSSAASGNTCGVVVGDTAVPTTGWKWVDYKSANTATKNNVTLTAGTHTLTMIGKEDSVKVDRIIFLSSDSTCIPQDADKGDSCIVATDTILPTVSISSPATNATLTGTTTIQATASDNVGVTKVDFYMGTTLLGTDDTSPYSFTLNTNQYTNGSYKLSAMAYDAANNSRRSTEIDVTINNVPPDTTPPQVSISAPVNNSTVAGTINVAASATDASGVARVEILIDNVVRTSITASPYIYSLNTTTLAAGVHTITARAYDNASPSNSANASVTVTVDNTPPPTVNACNFKGTGVVNVQDLSKVLSNYGKPVPVGTLGDCAGGTNNSGDGIVNVQDLSKVLSNYGK